METGTPYDDSEWGSPPPPPAPNFPALPMAPSPYGHAPHRPPSINPGHPYPYWPQPHGYSDKSKVAAGCMQLFPGLFLCIGGIGRLYAGHTALGVVQLAASVFGWMLLVCGFWLVLPIFFFLGLAFWFAIDGVVLMAGSTRDQWGRPLR